MHITVKSSGSCEFQGKQKEKEQRVLNLVNHGFCKSNAEQLWLTKHLQLRFRLKELGETKKKQNTESCPSKNCCLIAKVQVKRNHKQEHAK